MPRRLNMNLHRLLRREDGAATLLIGFAATLLVASAGVAIDMGRVQTVQSRLSSALDAAGLAAGNAVNSGNINEITHKYFWANYPADYMGSNINNPSIVANADNSVLTLDVNGTVPTTFMKIFGIMSVPVQAHAEITRASLGLELVLVIDVTGSMGESAGGGLSKLQAAKNASTDLINILYGDNLTLENVWVGLIPFSQAVNVGAIRNNWTVDAPMPSFGYGPTSWNGCVDARWQTGHDVTDEPPRNHPFTKYYWNCDGNNSWYGNNWSHSDCDTWGNFGYNTPLNSNRGPNKYCPPMMTALTSNKNAVLGAISVLTANGSTHINLGAVWGWRMLSPRWRNFWGGEMDVEALPLNYNTPLMNKVMILMSDGDNVIHNSMEGAYGYLSAGTLGTTNSNTATTILNNRTTQVCNSMKANGIIIYTIAFGTGIGSAAQSMLQNCASNPDFYFYSPTAGDLSSAFHQIGDSLANLRVSQ